MKLGLAMSVKNIKCLFFTLMAIAISQPICANTVADASSVNVIGYRMVDSAGNITRLGTENGVSPVAVIFLDHTCPISRRLIPRLNEIYDVAKKSHIEFYGVFSNPNVSWIDAEDFRAEYQLKFPVLFDSAGELADRLKPSIKPEAFVINQKNQLIYHGRIDDRFVAVGKLKQHIEHHDLLNAINAAAKNQRPKVQKTKAVGCFFESWSDGLPEKITYNRHVEPLLQANCAECHVIGGIAPFPLDNFKDASMRAHLLAYVTKERLMPPWRATPGFGSFRDERILSDREIALIESWAQNGAKRGEEKPLKYQKKMVNGWRLGKPDLELTMTEPYELPANGDDIYRYFVIPSGLWSSKNLVAIDFKPGDTTVVHHANIFIDYSGRARAMDNKDPKPGFSVFGTGGFMSYDAGQESGMIGVWAPGAEPYKMPKGYGTELPGGGDVVVEIHYHLSGKATKDQSTVALYFSDEEVKPLDFMFVGTNELAIDAGDKKHKTHLWMKVPAGFHLVDIAPHMHYIGKTAKVSVTKPNGEIIPIVSVEDWDIRWQNMYVMREPVYIPKGSRLDFEVTFDNSAENPANPNNPPRMVPWGWASGEEMAELYLTIIPDDRYDMGKLIRASRASWGRDTNPSAVLDWQAKDVADVDEAMKLLKGKRFWQDEGAQMLVHVTDYDFVFDLIKKYNRFANNQRDPDILTNAGLINNVGSYISLDEDKILQYAETADSFFEKALEQQQDHWGALFSRAESYRQAPVDMGLTDYAVDLLEAAIEVQLQQPKQEEFIRTYTILGDLYKDLKKEEKAKQTYQKGLKQFPNNLLLTHKLDLMNVRR